MNKPYLKLTIKDSQKQLFTLDGKVNAGYLQVGELAETIEIERMLEKLFGYRFHISLVDDGLVM